MTADFKASAVSAASSAASNATISAASPLLAHDD